MAMAERRADVTWEGNLTEGKGTINKVGSGAFGELPITWAARTNEQSGGKTSPEELIAAAHASCYSMAFSNELFKAGYPPERVDVTAVSSLDRVDGKTTITGMALTVRGTVPNITADEFKRIAEEAKKGCPVSRALQNNVNITLDAELA